MTIAGWHAAYPCMHTPQWEAGECMRDCTCVAAVECMTLLSVVGLGDPTGFVSRTLRESFHVVG